ncbi:MAG: hypothetical protein ACXVPQ_02265 [Bacteroidia bacterium]
MKPTCIISAIALACALSSCQKEYVCVCTNAQTGNTSYGDKMKAGPFTKKATEEACKNNNNLSAGSLKDCHLE